MELPVELTQGEEGGPLHLAPEGDTDRAGREVGAGNYVGLHGVAWVLRKEGSLVGGVGKDPEGAGGTVAGPYRAALADTGQGRVGSGGGEEGHRLVGTDGEEGEGHLQKDMDLMLEGTVAGNLAVVVAAAFVGLVAVDEEWVCH